MRKSVLLLLAAWDEFCYEVKWAVKKDIRRLIYMLKPVRDVETKEKIYRVVPESCDHDNTSYCMFCDKITTTCTVTTSDGGSVVFCNRCGYELVVYDMETI